MKRLLSIFILTVTVLSFSCCAQKSSSMQEINALIEAGDTIAEAGGYTPYVIIGAKVTPEMFDNSKDIIRPEQMSSSPLPDSELCVVMHHNGDMFACKKYFIDRFFPDAKEYIVDGEKVTAMEFNRIPASLLLSVTGEKEGGKLLSKHVM